MTIKNIWEGPIFFFPLYPKMSGGLQVTWSGCLSSLLFQLLSSIERMECWAGLASSWQLLQDQFSLGAQEAPKRLREEESQWGWPLPTRHHLRSLWCFLGRCCRLYSLFCLCPVHAFHPRNWSMSRDFLEDWLLTYPGSRVRISRHPMMWPLEHQRITLSKCSQCQSGDTCSLDCMACCLSPKHCQGWNLIKW